MTEDKTEYKKSTKIMRIVMILILLLQFLWEWYQVCFQIKVTYLPLLPNMEHPAVIRIVLSKIFLKYLFKHFYKEIFNENNV